MDSTASIYWSKDADDYIKYIVGFLKDSHVDALFWGDGTTNNTANWDSDVLELNGERIGKVRPFLLKLIREGNDPPKIIPPAVKKLGIDIFFSFRINDAHDSFGSQAGLPTYKVEHPEWLIGKSSYHHRNLNFAVPEVRDIKFAVIEEIFRKYDFDGLEIDFMRHPPHFIPGTEPENAHILTRFLRRVRKHLDQRGKERGRPIMLAVRVDDSLKACHLDGFDVATWIKEEIIDIIIMGSGAIDIEVEEFKKLAKGTNVQVYPCLYGYPSKYRPTSPEMHRAWAANYWHQGADGIYTFNWNTHSYVHRPEQTRKAYQPGLLREVDNPELLRGKNKIFTADRHPLLTRRTAASPRHHRHYPHSWMHTVLPVTLETGKQTEDVPIMVGEDLTKAPVPKNIVLKINCEDLSDEDELEIELNGSRLSKLSRYSSWLRIPLKPNQLKLGRNQVTLLLVEGELTVTALEIHVLY